LIHDQAYPAFTGLSFLILPEPVKALCQALEAWDGYSGQHSVRVTRIALQFARYLGLPPEVSKILRTAGYLHDIGKLAIDNAILLKPGLLTPREWVFVENHPGLGKKLVEPLGLAAPEVDLILHHHERWDGLGYPAGLSRDNITVTCQVLALADCYDALTSDRPYRRGRAHREALAEVKRVAGRQFRYELALEFIELMVSLAHLKEEAEKGKEKSRGYVSRLPGRVEILS
jgi:putative nucleotidyltransferase with HDIG domain